MNVRLISSSDHPDREPVRYAVPRRVVIALKVMVVTLLCSGSATSLFAQGNLTTQNQFVGAQVDFGTGFISIYEPPSLFFGPQLSYGQHSYLNVQIDGRTFTNNAYPPDTGTIYYLPNPSVIKVGDTITTTWSRVYGVDIIQKVYPVLFAFGGQIVISISFRNPPKGGAATVQAQFLLDTDPGSNDQAKILTRYAYNIDWSQWFMSDSIPWFYLNFQNNLPGRIPGNAYYPGVTGQGLINDAPLGSPLKLIVPDRVIIGDWGTLAGVAWWSSANIPSGPYSDGAVLFEWPQATIQSGQTYEDGRTSYGTGLFFLCDGNLPTISMYPDPLHLDPTKTHYIPDPFKVESFVVNTNSLEPALGISLSLIAGPYLTIDSPLTRLDRSHKIDTQYIASILPDAVAEVDWILDASLYKTCRGDTLTHFSLIGHSAAPGPPMFVDTCLPTIDLPGVSIDTDAPQVRYIDTTTFLHRSVSASDTRCSDLGLRSIAFTFSGQDTSKFRVKYSPSFAPCDIKDTVVVSVTELDSTASGCFNFTFTDCAGNQSFATLCFVGHTFVPPDTVAPRFALIHAIHQTNSMRCSAQCDSLRVEDDSANDLGLDSLALTPKIAPTNMSLSAPSISDGERQAFFTVCVDDSMKNGSISIRAWDVAGNYRDTVITYCTTPDTSPPMLYVTPISKTSLRLIVTDSLPWDRGIDSIVILNSKNIIFSPQPPPNVLTNPVIASGRRVYTFTASIVDTSLPAEFCVYATDLAHNYSRIECFPDTIPPDIWLPNIVLTPAPNSNLNNPSAMVVEVNDIHFIGTDSIGWDKGVDSVWFSDVHGLTVPSGFPLHSACLASIPPFTVFVTDTLSLDTVLACFTIHAMDCAGNQHDTTWCYSYFPDHLAPLLHAMRSGKNWIAVDVEDSSQYDRGIHDVTLQNATNLSGGSADCMGAHHWRGNLTIADPSKSAVGILSSEDLWGSLSTFPAVQKAHTASVEVHSWVQNYKLQEMNLYYATSSLPSSGIIDIPMQFVRTDTFSLARKQISQYSFSFKLVGDPQLTFVGFQTTNSLSSNWSINLSNSGGIYTIVGNGPILSDTSQPLLILQIHDNLDIATRQTAIEIIGDSLGTIHFNGNRSDTLIGDHATAILSAPTGTLTGATIVVAGTCVPNLAIDSIPLLASIEPPHPNPFRSSVGLNYSVGTEGFVSLVIYDALGREVSRLVSQSQKPGYYSRVFDAVGCATGTYFVRLESGNTVVTRQMVLTR